VIARAEHGPVACTWLSSECDWISGQRIKAHVYNTGTGSQA